jgi:diadenylate cyclase
VTTSLLGPFLEMRLTDVIDILFVTALLSAAIIWIRRTEAVLVATGIAILGGIYGLARTLGLQLTAWIFQGFFAISVVIIVVIFQEELRQLFERLAVWSLGRRERAVAGLGLTDVLVKCVADFARDRVGALIVLPGRQPIARHVQGGLDLDGKLSIPLLKSIFDEHSPGHDGAVILADGKVARFAVHLPLSKDLRQLRDVGTRHAAALGLAELTDALCLVASEERGRISVAHDGRLQELPSPQALGPVIEQFLAARRPPARGAGPWAVMLRRNWVEKLVSLILVLGLWYLLVPGARAKDETFVVPVSVTNLPEGYTVESVTPETVAVSLSGRTRSFYLLDRRDIAVSVDASLARLGRRTFQISDDDVHRPRGLDLADVDPGEVKLSLTRAAGGAAGGGR